MSPHARSNEPTSEPGSGAASGSSGGAATNAGAKLRPSHDPSVRILSLIPVCAAVHEPIEAPSLSQ
jgi:hypothetical protein